MLAIATMLRITADRRTLFEVLMCMALREEYTTFRAAALLFVKSPKN